MAMIGRFVFNKEKSLMSSPGKDIVHTNCIIAC
uniref:Uncharacterized protein n=1 Tax=Anguilla anguilla TaxID=7936 RepID=A0A0E9U0R0_ANGAN